MGACCSEFDGESYEEDFSSDESSDEGTPPVKHLPCIAHTTCNRVTWTPPRPMLVVKAVKDDALGLTGVSRKDVFQPSGEIEMQSGLPELPRLGLWGTLKPEFEEKTGEITEKTVAKDLKTRSHRRGLSSVNGLSQLADPKEEVAMEEWKEAEETKEIKTLAKEFEEKTGEITEKTVAKDLKTRSHRRGLSSVNGLSHLADPSVL